jgi:adiponectin receptor
MIHNESVNIWTHLAGVALFCFLFWYSFFMLGYTPSILVDDFTPELIDHVRKTDSSISPEAMPSWLNTLCHSRPGNTTAELEGIDLIELCSRSNLVPRQAVDVCKDYAGPMMVFIGSAVFCLSCSSLYHLFNSHSLMVNNMMSRLDYSGTSILIAGSFFPVVYYTFFCYPFYIKLYLGSIGIFSSIVFAVAMLPFFQTSKFRWLRGSVFLALGLIGFVPLTHFAFLPDLIHFPSTLVYFGLMGASYIIGVLVYVSRVPERFYPGKFDLWGSSHNIWHCFVVLAAVIHFIGSLDALAVREVTFCPAAV